MVSYAMKDRQNLSNPCLHPHPSRSRSTYSWRNSFDPHRSIKLWGISDISSDSWHARARKIANRNMTREEWRTYMGDRPYRKIFEDLPGPPDAR